MEDKETVETLKDGEELAMMVRSRGWSIAMDRLSALLSDVDSLRNIEFGDVDRDEGSLRTEIIAKQTAIEMVRAWVSEITGLAEQHEVQGKDALKDARRGEEVVKRFQQEY